MTVYLLQIYMTEIHTCNKKNNENYFCVMLGLDYAL